MGVHLTFIALGAIGEQGGSTPTSTVRTALAKLGVALPDLEDGCHQVYLANAKSSIPHIGEDTSFSVAGSGITSIGVFRPCSPGIRALCYELMACGFIMLQDDECYATPDALRNVSILSDKNQFPHGLSAIGGPDDFPWVSSGTLPGSA